jgi:signal peptidase II
MNRARATAILSLFWGVGAFVLDRAHKFWQIDIGGWKGGEYVPVTPFFDYVLVWNTGVSYGLFGGMPLLFLGGIIVVALLALGFWWWKASHLLVQIGLMLCIGGALSNALDRLLYGAVFNIADSAITVGVLLLLLDLVGFGRPKAAAEQA